MYDFIGSLIYCPEESQLRDDYWQIWWVDWIGVIFDSRDAMGVLLMGGEL